MKHRILFVLPSLYRGGAETQTVDLVNGLDEKKFVKHLFTFETQLDQLARLDAANIYFYNHPRKYKFDFSMVTKIARIIDGQAIDVVHCTLQIALLMGWLGVKMSRRKPPMVCAIHTTLNRDGKDDILDRCLYQHLMRGCQKVICVCEAQESHWQQKFPFLRSKTCVVYNGIDTDRFNLQQHDQGKTLRTELNIDAYENVVCCIAGFRPEKGHMILITAFAAVLRRLQTGVLLLAGDGKTRAAVEQAVRDNDLQKHVHFLGNVDDVRPVLAASDVSVIASTAVETFSVAMLESLAMGVPMVATDIGGAKEAVVHEWNGLIVSPGNTSALAEALYRLLSHPRRAAMGLAGRKYVEMQFTDKMMVKETAEVLRGCARG